MLGAYIYSCHVFLLDWSLDHYVVSFFISCNLLYFKVCFVWCEDCYSSFLLLPICMQYIFPSSHFQSICILRLKSVSSRQHIYGSCFCIHSSSLCLSVGTFNPFMVKSVWAHEYLFILVILIHYLLFSCSNCPRFVRWEFLQFGAHVLLVYLLIFEPVFEYFVTFYLQYLWTLMKLHYEIT